MVEEEKNQSGRKRAMRSLCSAALLALCAAVPGQAQGAPAAKTATPILVELFTSEGCSSCPPADAWLGQLDSSQPVSGAQVIVLSEHVDYWNHDGWTDRYSSAFFTDRQSSYVHAMAGSQPYTPEMILNGATELKLSDMAQLKQAFSKAAGAQQLPVAIGAVSVDGGSLHAHVDVDGAGSKHGAEIFAAIALDHAESQVTRGENKDHHLTHTAVALDLVRVGKLEKGKPFSQDVQVKLKPGAEPGNLRLIVFVQESGPGAVLGAALKEVSSATTAELHSPIR